MKIAWFCIPAHGHTNPTLALVKALTGAGHEVVYFSFEPFREAIERAGATFIPCDDCQPDMDMAGDGDRVGKDLVFATELLVESTLALDERVTEMIAALAPDLIVSDSVAYWGKLAAMKHGVPYVSSTTTFAFNRYSAKYMQQGAGSLLKMLLGMPKMNRELNKLRDKGYPVKSILQIITNDNETPTIVYTSKGFQPCADTFSDKYCFIGPSIRPVETPMQKTASKTVYVSLGTVVKNPAFYENCIQALGGTGYQVVVSLGERARRLGDTPANVQVYDRVDQMAALAIADVFVTHCGMNSVSEALYHETPLVMLPQTPEQGAVAKRVAELGAGKLLDETDPASIRAAVDDVLSDARMRGAAKEIAQGFRACGGAQEARAFLERMAAQ